MVFGTLRKTQNILFGADFQLQAVALFLIKRKSITSDSVAGENLAKHFQSTKRNSISIYSETHGGQTSLHSTHANIPKSFV